MLKHVSKSLAILLIVPAFILTGCSNTNSTKQAGTPEKTIKEPSDTEKGNGTEEKGEVLSIDQLKQDQLTVTHEISENTPEKVTVKFDIGCSANVEKPHYSIQLVDQNDEPVAEIALAGKTSIEHTLDPVQEETTYKVRVIVASEDGKLTSDVFELETPLVITPALEPIYENRPAEEATFSMSCVSDETVKIGINPNANDVRPYFHIQMLGEELTSLRSSIGNNPGGCVVDSGSAIVMVEASAGENGDCKLTISDVEKKDTLSIEINAELTGKLLTYRNESQGKTLKCSTENIDMLTALCP